MTSAGPREADSSLGGHKRNLARTKTQRKGAVTPQETEPKLPANAGVSPCGGMCCQGLTTGIEALATTVLEGPPW